MKMPPTSNNLDVEVIVSATVCTNALNTSALVPTSPVLSYEVRPLLSAREFGHINALPPAARANERAKRANTFASSGKTVFVHYVEPVLDCRRTELLSKGTHNKKYNKTAAQLWQGIRDQLQDEWSFWHQQAAELRVGLKQGQLSHEQCLKDAGRPKEARRCIWHAEIAVGHYLDIPPPPEPEQTRFLYDGCAPGGTRADLIKKSDVMLSRREDALGACITASLEGLDLTEVAMTTSEKVVVATYGHDPGEPRDEDAGLLDTLPDRFDYTTNMLYSHFARYDFGAVRQAEGKHQTAMLRQLADLLDKSGKELFYYYTVPRLCKTCQPPNDGSTVTSLAGDVWRFLPGQMKGLWASVSAALKKCLGDGDGDGLAMLQLDSLEHEVLRLHGMAEEAIKSHAARESAGWAKKVAAGLST
ncbi:hypothetical protein LTR36_002265 [Oleoguttula mirabilis]|uniref:Uncharacterized protein n=1 Tax=Oleoguttula mirabilis TaxID=1507867 RepID=A0AAV9JNL2_9PEZI|nr:hypothetical protein LTR36_002265 [Oleoguttula mirabilis]